MIPVFALFASLSLAVSIVFAVRVVVFLAVVVFQVIVVVHDLDRKVLEGADLVHQDLGFTEESTSLHLLHQHHPLLLVIV